MDGGLKAIPHLTKTEFLEFYASGSEHLSVVLDLGLVSEDAFFIDAAGRTQGVKANGDLWGLGFLDQEADPARGEIWSEVTDRRGVWGESCQTAPQAIYRIGDPRTVCTRSNGRRDSEDLDGNGNLEVGERHLRYLIQVGPGSPYLVRSRAETGSSFRLYRVPIQDPAATHVGGSITEADLRAVKHLRLTVAGSRSGAVTLARMSFIGSRWIKRAGAGVLRGLNRGHAGGRPGAAGGRHGLTGHRGSGVRRTLGSPGAARRSHPRLRGPGHRVQREESGAPVRGAGVGGAGGGLSALPPEAAGFPGLPPGAPLGGAAGERLRAGPGPLLLL